MQAVVTPRWYDRSGVELEALGDPGEYFTVALAPDDRSAALTVSSGGSGSIDIWTYDLERDLRTRFTFDDATDYLPVWAPDGRSIAFASDRSGTENIYRMFVGGVREAELLVESDRDLSPYGWSPDGEWLLFAKDAEETGNDIWAVRLDGTSEPRELRAESGIDVPGSVSPDGRWLSYYSDESGRFEVYVTPFPDASRRWQASTDLAGENSSFPAVSDALVLAEHEADFATANADVAGGYVCMFSDMTIELCHKALAEAHDFVV